MIHTGQQQGKSQQQPKMRTTIKPVEVNPAN
jgi:hypothetical protein